MSSGVDQPSLWARLLRCESAEALESELRASGLDGDDAAAKQTATQFLDSIGYDALDTGSLADSWRQERDMPVYVTPYGEFGGAATPAPRETVQQLVDRAER